MLETDRLLIRLLDEDDEDDIVRWRNQKDVLDNLFSYKGVTVSQHRIWYDKYSSDDTRIEFIMISKDNGFKIGTIGLSSIDYKNQKAEFGILIGERQERGKGLAYEASNAVLNYAISELNLHKIKLEVFSDNILAIKLYTKLGFKEEGILRQEIFKKAAFKDVTIMALLKEWFQKC